jgi:hypothetical protein
MAIINDSAIANQIANLVNGGAFDVAELTSLINSGLPAGQQLQVSAGLLEGPFKRFGSFDKVDAKTEVVTTGLWTGDLGSLTSFFTSSTQTAASTGDYYYNVYQADPSGADAEVQFAVAYGHVNGSGSVSLTNDDTSTLPTKATYKQYASTLLNDADNNFQFENGSGVASDSNSIYAINLSRTRFREKMDPGNWSLSLSGSNGLFTFIDNSGKKFGDTLGNAGRVFKVVSGSLNLGTENEATINTTTSSGDEGFGLFYPDRGVLVLNPSAIQATVGSVPYGSLVGDVGITENTENHKRLFQAIELGGDFEARRTENVSTQHFFVRATNREFNYSNNPTYTNTDGTFVETSFETDPKTYITTVGLFNDSNEMIAVAKTSQPVPKSFDKEVLIKVKLSF